MQFDDSSFLGFGLGLRRPHYTYVLENWPAVDWFEVISENFMVAGGRPLDVLERVRERYPIVLHGVSMSLGSSDPLNRTYLSDLAGLARRFKPRWISDHLCWTGVGGHNLHDLVPLPYTEAVVHQVAGRIRHVQEMVELPVLIENISSYIEFKASTLSEWEFLAAVAEEADCGILLDINNIYVNAYNHNFDSHVYIDAVPVDRVAQFHLAGHSDYGTYLLDTHDHPVREEVWSLYEYALRRFGAVSTLIEWDDNIPEFAELAATAETARRRSTAALNDRPR
ncbi:MAG: DUF692 domain-containing protein [Deltaproteobacteria bacterium]|nr:DUF692 domain-containing protein [Deltaproteobacteria bacterium]